MAFVHGGIERDDREPGEASGATSGTGGAQGRPQEARALRAGPRTRR
ncbi:hypothetical protein OHA77_14500 [Streptosporangium sp. NBC_01639]|nr:hypothetical protein OHA77_14500 [Streptosporangium sp. NBC_01639]